MILYFGVDTDQCRSFWLLFNDLVLEGLSRLNEKFLLVSQERSLTKLIVFLPHRGFHNTSTDPHIFEGGVLDEDVAAFF